MPTLPALSWVRHPANPILPNRPDSDYDCTCCMNPFVVVRDDSYWLYYAGGDAERRRRICLATAPLTDPTDWTRHGPVLDLGAPGAFDENWCVLPMVYSFGDEWRLYWTGRHAGPGNLQSFTGVGLATSRDGRHFRRISESPILTGDQTDRFPANKGIALGGTILRDGDEYRLYYTLATGIPSKDVQLDQEKHIVVCHSRDGKAWSDHRVLFSARRDVPHEDIAVAAPFVWREGDHYQMIYSGIGSRWGYYCLAQAVSDDGYTWERGVGDANLVLAPRSGEEAWDSQMVEYPCVIREGDQLRLFFCGNGYGSTGIGMAVCKL